MRWPRWLRLKAACEWRTDEIAVHAMVWNQALEAAADITAHAPLRETGIPKLRQQLTTMILKLRKNP